MSIILPNLNHSFICPVPVLIPDSGFRILDSEFPDFPRAPTKLSGSKNGLSL